MEVQVIEVSGFSGCVDSIRLPFKKECRSKSLSKEYSASINEDGNFFIKSNSSLVFDKKDLSLLKILIKNGDSHAKALRLINTTFKIKAPLFWWSEMDTYEVGVVNGCSESTMHTLKKEQLCQKFLLSKMRS